jgi:hypothetical protein
MRKTKRISVSRLGENLQNSTRWKPITSTFYLDNDDHNISFMYKHLNYSKPSSDSKEREARDENIPKMQGLINSRPIDLFVC